MDIEARFPGKDVKDPEGKDAKDAEGKDSGHDTSSIHTETSEETGHSSGLYMCVCVCVCVCVLVCVCILIDVN